MARLVSVTARVKGIPSSAKRSGPIPLPCGHVCPNSLRWATCQMFHVERDAFGTTPGSITNDPEFILVPRDLLLMRPATAATFRRRAVERLGSAWQVGSAWQGLVGQLRFPGGMPDWRQYPSCTRGKPNSACSTWNRVFTGRFLGPAGPSSCLLYPRYLSGDARATSRPRTVRATDARSANVPCGILLAILFVRPSRHGYICSTWNRGLEELE